MLTGEIGLSEIRHVFVEVYICPETIELQKESVRETHLAATVTRFELASRFQPAPARGGFISRGGEEDARIMQGDIPAEGFGVPPIAL